MTSRKWILILLSLLAVCSFAFFIWPNAVASKNLAMVQVFEPDEAAPLPSIFNMIVPAGNIDQALRHFIFYDYYFYGFPYFGLSALLLVPLRWLGQLGNMPLVMLVLRQGVSVLPMLLALLLLVYLQDGFRTYRSPLLFAFLLCVPAVLQNNFWWHPDGLIFLLAVLTLFFLQRDNLRLGWNFVLAAVMCGIATAAKLVGVYFFLAVGLCLLLAVLLKKASWKKTAAMAAAFLLAMGLSFLLANPFLFFRAAEKRYIITLQKQVGIMATGIGVEYPKGIAASWPPAHQAYGELIFLLTALGAAIWGAWKGPRRLLHALILAWLVPLSVEVFFFTYFRFQYWLPAVLPLFSSLVILLPEKWKNLGTPRKARILPSILLLVVLIQFGLFLSSDVSAYAAQVSRAEANPTISFYNQAVDTLAPLQGTNLHVYYDYRLYVPSTSGWTPETSYDLLTYSYITDANFDILFLLEQRLRDYLNPKVTGVDPILFALNQQFYRDAENGALNGFHLVYRDSLGLIFVREQLFQQYFQR